MSANVIQIEQVTKYFGRFKAVSSVNFNVQEGEIFGFLGPNGAGKTTCIKMMLDLLRPDEGQVTIFGKEVRKNSIEIRNSIGFLSGSFTHFDNMTGIEFLKFASSQRKKSFVFPKYLCDIFHLSHVELNKKMKSMSHGMLQKIGIIQSVFHEPQLLILDEPTSGLDPIMQDAFYGLIKELNRKGTSIFFSSHNLTEVEMNCHHIAVIRDGKIVAFETLENLKKQVSRKLSFKLKNPMTEVAFSHAEMLSHDGLNYEFLVKGSIEDLLREMNDLPIVDFSFPEPGLDDIFMNYYNSGLNQ